ncbi:MAG: plasmid mobilization relaxosome protein MobC [Parahaliea sp.]
MADSHYKPTRYPSALYEKIERARGRKTFSAWIKEAAAMRLEGEGGLTPDYSKRLAGLQREITAIGRNLNQVARAANSGLPVELDRDEARRLGALLRETRDQLRDVQGRLS